MTPNTAESTANITSALAASDILSQLPTSTSTSSHATGIEREDIWSTILKGVASSKMVPTKNVLILGDPQTGKSTLIHHLKYDLNPTVNADGTTVESGVGTQAIDNDEEDENGNELALSYTFADIMDDENEDTIARLNLYHLSLSHPSYSSLLRFALNSVTLPDSLVIVVLDWTRPWTFVEHLERWMKVLETQVEEVIAKEGETAAGGWSSGKAITDEQREKLENWIQSYIVPDTNGTAPAIPPTTSSSAEQVVLPLNPGTLTKNLGVPIVVVCCKSDSIAQLKSDLKDEQFDFIQQALRTICLKYGAALFYTTSGYPQTFPILRSYIMHRLLHVATKPFPFNFRPQVNERDTVLVPSGWDSWGKIKVLGEDFDYEGMSQGWEADLNGGKNNLEEGEKPTSARNMYEDVIKGRKEDTQIVLQQEVTWEDEQVFFAKHEETLKTSDRPPVDSVHTTAAMAGQATLPSVVGPMAANSLDFTSTLDNSVLGPDSDVERKLRRHVGKPGTTPSPTNGASPNPESEAIAQFFQSLLTKKGSGGSGGGGSAEGPALPNAPNLVEKLEKLKANK